MGLRLKEDRALEIDGKTYQAHRIVWKMVNGADPKIIDHINGLRDDNRIENLQELSGRENTRKMKKSRSNKSGYRGVSWHKKTKKWRSYIRANNKNLHLGCFIDKEEAIRARKKAEIKYWSEG